MEKNETLIEGIVYRNVGTHETHCCAQHGCSYGWLCPVANKVVKQEFACPYCEPSVAIKEKIAELEKELAWSLKLESEGITIYEGQW